MSSAAVSTLTAQTDSPRVLLVIPGTDEQEGSSMIFARRQAAAVREAGAVVDVFYLRSRTSPLAIYREYRRFRARVKEVCPEVIHAHFGTVTSMFAALGAGRVPLVITYRGSDLNPSQRGGLRSRAGRLMSQLSALRASSIVCVSKQLKLRLWWARGRVSVFPSGVDTELFVPIPRNAARRYLGWNDRDRVVLFNAGHDPINKRLDMAEATVAFARQTLPGLRLEVMTGMVHPQEVPIYMNASDCLLVTSDSEGSPTVVQEALATNLPIVSVPVGDVAERLRDIDNTRVVDRDPEALAAAIIQLVRQPLRTNGRAHASHISARRIAEQLFCLYRRVRTE